MSDAIDIFFESFEGLTGSTGSIPQVRKFILSTLIHGAFKDDKAIETAAQIREEHRQSALNTPSSPRKVRKKKDGRLGSGDLPPQLRDLPVKLFGSLGQIASIEKGLSPIQRTKPGSYPLVVTASERRTSATFDFVGPAVAIPMVSSTGHGDASLKRIHYQEGEFAAGSILSVIKPISPHLINARFLYEYLTAFKEELLVSRMSGTANVSLTVNKLSEVPVPLITGSALQHLDELMALCDQLEQEQESSLDTHDTLVTTLLGALTTATADAGQFAEAWQRIQANFDTLFTTESSIDQLKQTILQLAVRGLLTPSDIKWSLEQFGEIFDIQGGTQPPKSQFIFEPQDGYVRLLQIRDLGEKPVPTFIPEESARRFCDENDILIGRYGASVGKIFKGQKGAYNVALAKLIWNPDTFAQDFLITWLKSAAFQDRLAGVSRSAQAGFNKGDLASIQIIYPPLAEQHRIVAKVDELMALCDQLKASLATAQTSQLNLADSLVEQAIG